MSEFESTVALQSVVLLGSAFMICWLMRRQNAGLRHYVWTLVLGFLLGLPLMPLLPEVSEVVPIAVPVTSVTRVVVRGGDSGWSPGEWVYFVWSIGVAVLLLVEVMRQLRGEWLRRRSVAGSGANVSRRVMMALS